MTQYRFFAHRTWEDWLTMILGLVTGLSPWISGEMGTQSTMFNAIVVGILIFLLGELEAVNLHRWEETAQIAVGIWLGASPIVFGYFSSGGLRFWHFGIAAIVIAMALFELWQDWNLSDKELAEHGE